MIYGWTILLISAVLIRAATFLIGLLTLAQLKILPFAMQVSIPVWLLALYYAYRNRVVSIDPAQMG